MTSSIKTQSGTDTPLCRTVLEFVAIMKRLVDQAKQPGFTAANWAPLGERVAQNEFERVGVAREAMGWHRYTEFLTEWACASEWEPSFRRIHEWSGVVFLELEERSVTGGRRDVINSLSVYAFNDAGKLHHLDVYMQSPAFMRGTSA